MGHEASHLAPHSRRLSQIPNSTLVAMKPQLNDSQPSLSFSKSAMTPTVSMTKSRSPHVYSIDQTMTKSKSVTESKSVTVTKHDIHNGVIGEYISLALAETAYVFWKRNICCLSHEEQLEIGCAIYFTMMGSNKGMKTILWNHAKCKAESGHRNIKRLGRQFLDMMWWLIRHLLTHNVDLKATLAQLGIGHKALGINASHFAVMLASVHETFAYYFEHKYSIKEKYAIDKLFTVAAGLMIGEDIHQVQMMDGFAKSFDDLDFLQSLSVCLNSDIGKEYLYRYFQQTFCDELVIYLQSIRRYQAALSDKERFMIARDICKTSVKPTAPFSINISYETRVHTLDAMLELEAQFFSPTSTKPLQVPITLFAACQKEIIQLIDRNHWNHFKTNITMLRNIS